MEANTFPADPRGCWYSLKAFVKVAADERLFHEPNAFHQTFNGLPEMRIVPSCSSIALIFLGGLTFMTTPASAADLLQAPENMVKYKLSNLRVEKGIAGDVIVFDYKRTREGSGVARLAGRSDQGSIDIHGFGMVFQESGTVRLQDHFAGIRSIMNRGEGGNGIEFYFVVGDVPFGFHGKQYLVSNPIRHGTMNTRLAARKPTKQEAAMAEQIRIARNPPRTLPAGHQRATAETKLVPGAPVKFGVAGKWRNGEVVSVSSTGFVKLVERDDDMLKTVRLAEWIAIADDTMEAIQNQPETFSTNIRFLTDGNLVLPADVVALDRLPKDAPSADELPKGTPLTTERHSKWVNAFLMSAANGRAKVLVNESNKPRVEFLPLEKLAIRQQVLTDINDPGIKTAYAENLATFESRASRLPGEGGSMETVGAFEQQSASNPFETTIEEQQPDSVSRTWKDATGEFEVKGRLISEEGTSVILKREDGKSIKVPIKVLSEADRTYLADRKKPKDDNPFNNVIDGPEVAMTEKKNSGSEARVTASSVDFNQPLELVRTIGDLGWGAASVAISPDNRFLLIGRKAACASLVDLKTGSMIVDSGRMNHIGDVTVCGFTPNGKQAVIGGQRGVIEVYDISSQGQMKLAQQFAAHAKEITSLCFSRDSKFAFTGSADKEARYWEVKTGRQIASLGDFSGKIKATRITPDGKLLLATDGEQLKVYDVAAEKIVREHKVGRSWASGQSAAFSPNGLLLAVGDGYKFHLWNLVTFTELPIVEGREIGWSAAFCPDNRHFVTTSNGVVNIWDAKTQQRAMSHPVGSSYNVQAITVSYDGTMISCPSAFKEVKVLKAATTDDKY